MFTIAEMTSLENLISIAQAQGLISSNEDGSDCFVDCGAVQVINSDEQNGMVGDILPELTGELADLTEEQMGECEVDEVAARKVLDAYIKELALKEQSFLCEEELFDKDASPSLYQGTDVDDVAFVVEKQIQIAEFQAEADIEQLRLDWYAQRATNTGVYCKREVFGKHLDAKRAAISAKMDLIREVQDFTNSRTENFRSSIWFNYFAIEDQESWFANYLDTNQINRYLTNGNVDETLDNAVLKSNLLDRWDSLAIDHVNQMSAEAAVVAAPLRQYEENLAHQGKRCNCKSCKQVNQDVENEQAFQTYLNSLSNQEVEHHCHVSYSNL